MKISWHRRCPKCEGKKVTRHYLTYTCERCRMDFRGKKIRLGPFVVRISFMPEDNRKKNVQPKEPLY